MYCTVIHTFSILFLCTVVLLFRLDWRHFLEDLAVNSGITLKWCLKKWVKCVLALIYSYVAVCKCCVVRYLIITGFSLLFSNYSIYVLYYSFYVCFLYSIFYFYFCILCFCIVFVLLCVLFLLMCCLFPIFVRVYRPLPPVGNPIAVNKYYVMKRWSRIGVFVAATRLRLDYLTNCSAARQGQEMFLVS